MSNLARSEPTTAQRNQVLLVDYDAGDEGHRGQYKAMLVRLFNIRRAGFTPAMLFSRQPVLCPQIEAAPFRFVITCLARALLGKRTVGFLLRPLPALTGSSLRLRLKRIALKLLRRTPGVQVLVIVSFAVEPGLAAIAHGWIHDLQNWDMQLDPGAAAAPADQPLAEAIRRHANGRLVCSAIGRQVHDKGFDRFAALYTADPELRDAVLFAFGGTVSAGLKPAARAVADAGGYALDRFVTDRELIEIYAASDLVWCVYAPDYDQASGVLGRAMQMGIPVAARSGSVIAAICAGEGHPCILLDDCSGGISPAAIPPRLAPELASRRASEHGKLSLARLAEALDAQPAWNPFASSAG